MPVIPESSDFPSAPQKGGNESEKKQSEQPQKATAQDFISKGPQIPDSKWSKGPTPRQPQLTFHRYASKGLTGGDRGPHEGTEQVFQLKNL